MKWTEKRLVHKYCYGQPLVDLVKYKFLKMARDGKEQVDREIEYLETEPERVKLIVKQLEDEQLAADLLSA